MDSWQQDEIYMREALKEAKKAYEAEEVPIGAVLVLGGKIIARAHNQVEMLKDATAHAEMLVLTMGASSLNNWRLLDTTLYVTVEPCMMCVGAMYLSRIMRLVFGAKDPRQGANGSFVDLFAKPHPIHKIEVTSDILSNECGSLMQEFFRKRREKNGR